MVKAKFRVDSKVQQDGMDYVTIHMFPVLSEDPESENKKFWDYTPAGNIMLSTTNLMAAEYFVQGNEYYVNFTEAA